MFVSLRWKAIGLIAAILIGLCSLLLFLNQRQMQSLAQQQQQQNFASINKELEGLLIQSYHHYLQLIDLMPALGSNDPQLSLQQLLLSNWPTLQLNWGIEDAAIYDHSGKVLWQTSKVQAPLPQSSDINPTPHWGIVCERSCRQVIIAPILTADKQPQYLQLEITMADMLIDFARISDTYIGIMLPSTSNNGSAVEQLPGWQQDIKIMTSPGSAVPILQALTERVGMHSALNQSNSITFQGRTYDIDIVSIEESRSPGYFVIIADTSSSASIMRASSASHMVAAVAGILFSCLLLLLFIWQPIHRLNRLAEIVPMLTSGNFRTALERLRENRSNHWLTDEIDQLNTIEENVCEQLTAMSDELIQRSNRLHTLATFDTLTQLNNRPVLIEQINAALKVSAADNSFFSLLFIDLDNFKRINDSLGHSAGDELLKVVSQRLRSCVRTTDTIARLGGDEFCIILTSMTYPQDRFGVAQNILRAVSTPIKLGHADVIVSASIGIVSAPADGSSSEELLRNAEIAMYKAKAQGRNNYMQFESYMTDEAVHRVAFESELRRAIRAREFILHYQPQIELENGRVFGFEALIRWQHPERGLLYPDMFISVLEETGLIVPLGSWVIDEVCRQIAHWHSLGQEVTCTAINLSPSQLQDTDLVEQVSASLERHQIPPHSIELEVTETMLMADVELTRKQLSRLQALGVSVAIDDFGTGHSSLSYLKSLPVNVLKIDRSFIQDITSDNDDREIVSAIIAMAHKLGLKVVAEGVETLAHQNILAHNACDFGQGFLYSKPVDAEAALELWQKGCRPPPLAGVKS